MAARPPSFTLVSTDEAFLCPDEDVEDVVTATHFGAPVAWLYLQHGLWPVTAPRPLIAGFGLIVVEEA